MEPPLEPPASFGSSTFEKARRKRVMRHLARKVRDEDTQELLPLGEVTKRLRLFDQTYLGVRPIPVDRIVGTVDRSHEFDREFLPRRPDMRGRWERLERSFPAGDFPPIEVYEVGGRYFLVDGHHRVAIARQRGVAFLDAEVTRIRTRLPFPEGADVPQLIHTEQERLFMEISGLERVRPEARIQFSRPQGYLELLDQIKVHGFNLMQERRILLSTEEIAADWYDRVYLATLEAVRSLDLPEAFQAWTDGDIFLAVQQQRVAMAPEREDVNYRDAAAALAEAVSPKIRGRRPRLPGRAGGREAQRSGEGRKGPGAG